jgi:hypothetical protein
MMPSNMAASISSAEHAPRSRIVDNFLFGRSVPVVLLIQLLLL